MFAGQFGVPGSGAAVTSTHRQILFGRPQEREVLDTGAFVSSTARDAGNTPTTVLRAGLLMGVITASGKWAEWNPDGSDGTEVLQGILAEEIVMTDILGTAVDRDAPVILSGPVKADMLLVEGTALVGDTDEYLARRLLANMGFRLSDDPAKTKAGLTPRYSTKITDYTVVAADNGTTFFATTADADFTLPAIKAGLEFEFIRASDHEMAVISAEGDNLVVGNDLSADSVTFTTASEQIGARVKVKGVYLGTTLKWLVELPQAPFGTAAGSEITIAIGT
jgi:hypothetical protein